MFTPARKGSIPPTPSIHRLQRGLPGYLILFAPHLEGDDELKFNLTTMPFEQAKANTEVFGVLWIGEDVVDTSASVIVQQAAFATGVPPNIYAFHRYTRNSACLSDTQGMQFQMQFRG